MYATKQFLCDIVTILEFLVSRIPSLLCFPFFYIYDLLWIYELMVMMCRFGNKVEIYLLLTVY